jgi:signal transduction histidine kinase
MVGGLMLKPYFLAGRATRVSGSGAMAMARGSLRAAWWTTQKFAGAVRLLDPRCWTGLGRWRLERKLLATCAAEQQRMGQDLHDGVGQLLTGVLFMSRALERELAAKLPDRAADAAQIAEIAEEGMAQTRSMVRVLDPVDLGAGDLPSALAEMALNFEKAFGVACKFEHDKSVVINDETAATHLYRIAQECATNAALHGGAKHIEIRLAAKGDVATLTVEDDGSGYAAEETDTDNEIDKMKDISLRILSCRAKVVGGELTTSRRSKGGTVVTCTFPKEKKQQ